MGEIQIESVYGQDPQTGDWLCPVRVLWGMNSHKRSSPVLRDRLCFLATQTGSYESACQVATRWGVATDDSTLHALVQETGKRAEDLSTQRVERIMSIKTRSEVVREALEENGRESFSLIIEMDGWQVRERGPEWGLKPKDAPGNRIEWHEMKVGVIFRLEHRTQTSSRRREIIEKNIVAYRGDPQEFGRRMCAEAIRRGLYQAKTVYFISDGAVWIWKIKEDRFGDAVGVLDLYHATQHLWEAGRAISKEEHHVRGWVKQRLRSLKSGKIDDVIKALEESAKASRWAEDRKVVERELEYFRKHRDHTDYARIKKDGCPMGSGAIESVCSQFQGRFKRTGQFWTLPGELALLHLEVARRNHDWDEIFCCAA